MDESSEKLLDKFLAQKEEEILEIMKTRYEFDKSDINNKEWLDYSNFVIGRRNRRYMYDKQIPGESLMIGEYRYCEKKIKDESEEMGKD